MPINNLSSVKKFPLAFGVLLVFLGTAASVHAFCANLSPSPSSLTIVTAQQGTVTVSVSTAFNVDYGTETFSATGLPTGVTATFSPSTVPYTSSGGGYLGGGGGYSGTSTLTLTVGANAPVGTYTVTIHLIGTGPDVAPGNTANLSLTISGRPVPEFPGGPFVMGLSILMIATVLVVFRRLRRKVLH